MKKKLISVFLAIFLLIQLLPISSSSISINDVRKKFNISYYDTYSVDSISYQCYLAGSTPAFFNNDLLITDSSTLKKLSTVYMANTVNSSSYLGLAIDLYETGKSAYFASKLYDLVDNTEKFLGSAASTVLLTALTGGASSITVASASQWSAKEVELALADIEVVSKSISSKLEKTLYNKLSSAYNGLSPLINQTVVCKDYNSASKYVNYMTTIMRYSKAFSDMGTAMLPKNEKEIYASFSKEFVQSFLPDDIVKVAKFVYDFNHVSNIISQLGSRTNDPDSFYSYANSNKAEVTVFAPIINDFCTGYEWALNGNSFDGKCDWIQRFASSFSNSSVQTNSISISDANYPTSLNTGDRFYLKGTVMSSSSAITSLTAGAYNSSGTMVTGGTIYPNAKSCSITSVDAYVEFNTLSAGNYTYRVTVTTATESKILLNQPFSIKVAKYIVKTEDCYCNIQLPKRVINVYNNVLDTTRADYFDYGPILLSKRRATISDGTIYYQIKANSMGELKEFWLKLESDMTIQEIPSIIKPSAPTIQCNTTYATVGSPVTVSWNSISGATNYSYYLTEYPEGWAYTTNRKSGTTTGTSISFTDLKSGKYSIFVHANNSVGSSDQSNWLSFRVVEQEYTPTETVTREGHFYSIYDYEMSWSFAKELCEKMGGHLVTINDAAEQSFISDLIASGRKDAYWIGADNYKTDAEEGSWKWVTGEEFSYTAWASGEPSSSGTKGEKEHFAEIRKSYSNLWNDVNNINKTNKGFILEVEIDGSDIVASETYLGQSRYYLIDKGTTWSIAEEYCKHLGDHLATVDSAEEYQRICDLISKGNKSWYYLGGSKGNYVGSESWVTGNTFNNRLLTWSDYDYGNRLFLYRMMKRAGWMEDCYHTIDDINCIGFVCEEDPMSLPSVVHPTSGEVHFNKQSTYRNGQFTDISENQWYTPSVAASVEFGIMKGTSATTFKPNNGVTLAEAITMAARIHSIYTTGSENFVQSDKWYQCYLDYAYQNGIISTDLYNSDVACRGATRPEFAEIFAAALPDEALKQKNTIADNAIPDVKPYVAYAPAIYKLYRAGILTGGDAKGTFSPHTFITRAECATIVARMADSDNRVDFTLS